MIMTLSDMAKKEEHSNCNLEALTEFVQVIENLACTTDKSKLWLGLSVKQCQNPCSCPSPVYQDLITCHDWPVNKEVIVHLPLRMEGNSKHTSSNSVNLLGAQNRDLGTASQTLL